MWVLRPKGDCQDVMWQLQAAVDVVRTKLANIGQQDGMMLVHPDVQSHRTARYLHIDGKEISWKNSMRYLEITLDRCVNFRQAAEELRADFFVEAGCACAKAER